ncbi:MAG TPA: hypothetical protein PLN52_06985 [Opitutaceae bacterium]|nr:hypothetical protein [Opitutaceae bacterium]
MTFVIKRFLIRWYQVSDRPLPGWLQRACDCDPRLAAELSAELGVTERLRVDARPPVIDPSPYLAARVNYAVKDSMARRGSFAVRNGFRMAALAGAVCLALLLFSRWPAPSSGTITDPRLATTESTLTLNPSGRETVGIKSGDAAVATVASPDARAVTGAAPALNWENPLDQEVNLVIADAKDAVRFLTTSFLPRSALAENKSG